MFSPSKLKFPTAKMKKGYQVRHILVQSRGGFQRIMRGPSGTALISPVRNRAMNGFKSTINLKTISATPFKIIGIRS